MAKRRVGKYPLSFRQMAMERMKDCPSVSALAEELGIHRTILYQWQRQLEHAGEGQRPGHVSGPRTAQAGARSEARAGGEDAGGGFFQRCLAKSRGSAPEQQGLWRDGIYDQIREVMPMQGSLSIERMCLLARVSRAGFYRFLKERQPREEDTEVRSAIQQIALEHRRRYGYRRVTAELKRRGMLVNHKRVARIMREDNLLAIQPKEFVTTTDSDHALEVYLNLARRMQLNGIDQLWVADITYIRLQAEFVYLAVILDGYSRKVVGWKLDRTLASRSGHSMRSSKPSNCDGRCQVLCITPIAESSTLRPTTSRFSSEHGIVPSMSRPANPYDNASCESFIKTLKREEIYANEYRDLEHLAGPHRGVHRLLLQPETTAFRPWLSNAGGVRSANARQKRRRVTFRYTAVLQRDPQKVTTALVGEGTQTPSLPHTPTRLGESTR